MASFKALVIDKTDQGQSVEYRDFDEEGLMEGDVDVRVAYSSLNYKDGLALTGLSPVVRRFPMIPGIDFSGIVEKSSHPDFKEGDRVLLNGWGTGETHLGAYAEKTRVKGDWLLHIPENFSLLDTMTIGTAGYTAALSLLRLELFNLKPAQGPAVISGATGGVGSIATILLSQAGWNIFAITGRPEESDYLKRLGATEILPRSEFLAPAKPLAKERWIAGIDTAGSHPLANMLAQTRYGGAIAACGLAAGADLPSSVMPFILRNVSLLGVDSVMCPISQRKEAWAKLATTLKKGFLEEVRTIIPFEKAIDYGKLILSGQLKGRTVISINPDLDQ